MAAPTVRLRSESGPPTITRRSIMGRAEPAGRDPLNPPAIIASFAPARRCAPDRSLLRQQEIGLQAGASCARGVAGALGEFVRHGPVFHTSRRPGGCFG